MPAAPNYYAEGPEALVVSLAAKGDKDAFAELVRRRQSWVRNLMRRCCADNALADDLSQQVFLLVWRKIRQLKAADEFGSWLKKIAIDEWLQYQRKNDRIRDAKNAEDVQLAEQDSTPTAMDLDNALATLPGAARLCVILAYDERMPHGEIAALLDMQPATVKSHMRRGSRRLRELLSAHGESP